MRMTWASENIEASLEEPKWSIYFLLSALLACSKHALCWSIWEENGLANVLSTSFCALARSLIFLQLARWYYMGAL